MKENSRLMWVCEICEQLGIDDPLFWMNHTDPRVVDLWIAYSVVKAEADNNDMKPAQQVLQRMAKQWQT